MLLQWVVLVWQTLYRKELLAKQDIIAYWYYWTRLLIKILHRYSWSRYRYSLVDVILHQVTLQGWMPRLCSWNYSVYMNTYVHRLHLCSWSHYYMINIHHCRCTVTHILFSSSRAWSHLRYMPMELLSPVNTCSSMVFVLGHISTTSHHYSHSAWLSSLNNQAIVVRWLMLYLDLHYLVHDYHSLVAKYRHLCSWSHTVHGHILFGHDCWARCHEGTPCV